MAQSTDGQDGSTERYLAELAAALLRTQEQVQALAARVGDLTGAVRQIVGQMEAFAAGLREVTKLIEALAVRIGDLTTRMDRVEAQIEALAARIDDLTARMDRVEAQIEALTTRMERVEAQIEALAARIDDLTTRMERVEAQIEALTTHVGDLAAEVRDVVSRMDKMTDRLGEVWGGYLEDRYRTKAPAYFGLLVRRAKVVTLEQLDDLLEKAVERGAISPEERRDLLSVDLVVQGKSDDGDLYLAIEVSGVVDETDVRRAARRAGILAKVVGRVRPIVAGEGVAPNAPRAAEDLGVWQVLDGRVLEPSRP